MTSRRAALLRATPLAVLVVVVLTLALVRATRTSKPASPNVELSAASGSAQPGPLAPLRGTLPDAAAQVAPGPARMLHGDARHTHRASGRGPRAAKVAWRAEVGGAVQGQVTASPDGQTLYVATLAGSLVALGVDGQKRWSVALGDRAYGTPCVGADGTIYVGSDAKAFFAISPEGRVRWRLELDGEADTSAVITRDGNVVFAAGATVYAARPGGDVAWRFRAKKKVFSSPALTSAGRVVFGSQDHSLYALEPNGALAWATSLGADVDAAVAIGDDGAIFAGSDAGEIVRLGDRGEIVWRTPVGGFVRGALSVARDGDVLAGVYGPAPRVVRLAPDGRVRGAFPVQGTGSELFGVHGAPLEDDEGVLYFGTQDDYAYAVGLDGRLLWRFATGGDIDAPLTLLPDGKLVVPSDDGTVTLLGP